MNEPELRAALDAAHWWTRTLGCGLLGTILYAGGLTVRFLQLKADLADKQAQLRAERAGPGPRVPVVTVVAGEGRRDG